jgi:hypothetical protein
MKRVLAQDIIKSIILSIILIFLTYRSFQDAIFYINWIVGFFVFLLYVSISSIKIRINVVTLHTANYALCWLVIALLLTPFTKNINTHIIIFLVSLFYTVICILIMHFLFDFKIDLIFLSNKMLLVWTIINVLFLIAYFAGIYIPRKLSFSGIFYDRNVFSITTAIIIGFNLGSIKKKIRVNSKEFLLFLLCFIMIVISRSLTGIVCVGFLLINIIKKSERHSKWLILILSVLSIFLLITTNNVILQRIMPVLMAVSGRASQLYESESAYIRLYLIINGFRLGVRYLFTGVGLDNAQYYINWPSRDVGSFLHNTYMDIFTSIGLIGFLFYYFPIIYAFFLLNKRSIIRYCYTNDSFRQKRNIAVIFFGLKIIYDCTWTTYFEFGMIFPFIFLIYCSLWIKNNYKISKMN